MKLRTRKSTKQTALLCTVSVMALATDLPRDAFAQASLPPVTVDAPQPQQRARSTTATRSQTSARATRRTRATTPQIAPAPSVNERMYAADNNSYVAGQASSASKT